MRLFTRRTKIIVFSTFILVTFVSNLVLFLYFYNTNWMPTYLDVDRRPNGNTFISAFSFREVIYYGARMKNRIPVPENSPEHYIFEIDKEGNTVWKFDGLAHPHEIEYLPNGHILVADTGFDRVIEIDYPNENIVYEWKPELINWTQVNPKWDSSHYYNQPFAFDWTHLNDVDFKNYSTWSALLISIRNFDLIVEVNYTAEQISPNDPSNIVWYFGEYGNHSLLNHQHNPDYLSDGNIIVSDSENNRILKVNYTTKEIYWIYQGGLNWPRDADELENGNILITDSMNGRIIEVDEDSKAIVWEFRGDLLNPYEADRLENGNTLVGNGLGGVVYEINHDGIEVWRYGHSYLKIMIYLNCILAVIIESTAVIFILQSTRHRDLPHKKKVKRYVAVGFLATLIAIAVIFFFFYIPISIGIFVMLMGTAR